MKKLILFCFLTPYLFFAQTLIWQDDFSDPSTWTINNSGQTGAQFGWNINSTSQGWWSTSGNGMNTNGLSGGNNAEIVNGNPALSPGTQAIGVTYTLTSSPIDISTYLGLNIQNLNLQFQQFGARFNDYQDISISSNGIDFVSYGDNLDMPVLTSTGGSAYPNPDKKIISLPSPDSFANDSIWIRFSWTSAFIGSQYESDPIVWIAYGWYIDDVKLYACTPYSSTINVTTCDIPYISPTNNSYNTSGNYNEIISSVITGCDSVFLTINLNVPSQYLSSTSQIQSSYCNTPNGSIINNHLFTLPQSIFISEHYYDNVNDVYAIEIYNPLNTPFNLGNLTSSWSGEGFYITANGYNKFFPVNTVIPPHSTYVLSNSSSVNPDNLSLNLALQQPEIQLRSYYLSSDDSQIDNSVALSGNSRIRKSFVNFPNSNYNLNEWDSSLQNNLGFHNYEQSIITSWSNGHVGDTLLNVPPSNYIYNIIYSQGGCVLFSDTVTVPNTGNNFNPTFSSAQQLYTAPPFAVQFSNSTVNASNYTFTWDFGDGTVLNSNNPTVFHQYANNGQYTVSLIATDNVTGCSDTTTLADYIFCTGGTSCTHTAAISQTSPQQACQGTPLWLSCNSDPSFTYQWRRNGVTIPGNNNDSLQVSQSGTYSVIISVNNCPITSGNVVVTIFSAPSTPIITSSGAIQPCVGGSVTLNAGSYTTYNWSTGATTQSINVTNSGNYSVSVTGANSCSATSAPFNVNASFVAPPQVCIVGMDSLTNENRIVWEKPLTLGIDSFYVYKESNVSNVYTKIGATDYNQLAVFLDANSNPAVQAYRYKISALDTCGTETPLSDFHKTIHLTINQGVGNSWNLIWSHYEGLTFGSYRIYRGTSLSNMALLTTIQSNLNSYTDLTPPTGPLYYQIEVVNPNNCDPTKIINYGVSKSNIVNNGLSGLSEEVLSTINVYPNPTNDKFTLNVSNDLLGKGYVIIDFSGRIISQGKINALIQTIDVQEISKGAYFLQIDKSTAKAIKIIKQ